MLKQSVATFSSKISIITLSLPESHSIHQLQFIFHPRNWQLIHRPFNNKSTKYILKKITKKTRKQRINWKPTSSAMKRSMENKRRKAKTKGLTIEIETLWIGIRESGEVPLSSFYYLSSRRFSFFKLKLKKERPILIEEISTWFMGFYLSFFFRS